MSESPVDHILQSRALTQAQWRTVLRRDPCSYCGGPSRDADHIIPQMLGGGAIEHNETGACRRCNARKRSKTLLAHLSGLPVGPDEHTYHAAIQAEVEAERAKLAA